MRYAVLILTLAVAAPSSARADWRYCLGVDRPGGTVYLSAGFTTEKGSDALDAEFERDISRRVSARLVVHCPRAANQDAIKTARKRAVDYNREDGNAVIEMPWWPSREVAGLP